MKLFLVALLGLLTMAAAQTDPQDFAVYWNGTESRDIQLEEIETEKNEASAKEFATQLTELIETGRYNFSDSGQKIPVPPGYVMALNSTNNMFDKDSAKNQPITETNTTTTTTTTTTRSPRSEGDAASSRDLGASSSRHARHALFPLYNCPQVTYLLRWFPVNSNGWWKICFVPWAWLQRITYVGCRSDSCSISLFENRGRCQPSCYQRRYILAFCAWLYGEWEWSWELRYLPQACRCSTC